MKFLPTVLFTLVFLLSNCKKPCEGPTIICTHTIYYAYALCNYDLPSETWIFQGVMSETKTYPVNVCDTAAWLQETRIFDRVWATDPANPTWEVFQENYPNTCGCE